PFHDRRDRPSRREVVDVPVAGARLGPEEGASALGSRPALRRPGLPQRRRRAGRPFRAGRTRAGALVRAGLLWLWLGCLIAPAHAGTGAEPAVVRVTARKFAFSPGEIVVHRGETVILELTSSDRTHGFSLPALGVRVEVEAGQVRRLRLRPTESGRFPF